MGNRKNNDLRWIITINNGKGESLHPSLTRARRSIDATHGKPSDQIEGGGDRLAESFAGTHAVRLVVKRLP